MYELTGTLLNRKPVSTRTSHNICCAWGHDKRDSWIKELNLYTYSRFGLWMQENKNKIRWLNRSQWVISNEMVISWPCKYKIKIHKHDGKTPLTGANSHQTGNIEWWWWCWEQYPIEDILQSSWTLIDGPTHLSASIKWHKTSYVIFTAQKMF